MNWKAGRGKLGVFAPILGDSVANAGVANPTGPNDTERRVTFAKTLDGAYVQLEALWNPQSEKPYRDLTLFGTSAAKQLCFWSFTNDGKQSHGVQTDVSDLHPQAFGFEAQMPQGLARQAFWPGEAGTWLWRVESHTKKGWRTLVQHEYTLTR